MFMIVFRTRYATPNVDPIWVVDMSPIVTAIASAPGFFLISVIFVWRSFYAMRIDSGRSESKAH